MERKVIAIDDIIFETDPEFMIPKNRIYVVEGINVNGVILHSEDEEERFMIDQVTFEAGFRAVL